MSLSFINYWAGSGGGIVVPPTGVSYFNLWKSLPTVANINYTSVANSSNTTQTLSYIVITPGSAKEAQPSHGVYKKLRKTFKVDPTVWSNAFPNTIPKASDYLIVNGIKWTLMSGVDYPQLGSLYRLSCVNLLLNPVLETTITISPPAFSTDSYLSPITGIGSQLLNVPAGIIEVGTSDIQFQGKPILRRHYDIYTYEEIDVPKGTSITDAALNNYIVGGYSRKNRLDELMVYHCYRNDGVM